MKVSMIASLFQNKNYYDLISMIESEQERGEAIDYKIIYYQALAYIKTGAKNKALDLLDVIIQGEPDGSPFIYQCRMLKGYLFCTKGEYDIAIHEFSKLIDEGYESSMLYAALGHAAFNKNDIDYAIESLEKSLKLDESNVNALNSISYILAKENIDVQRALKYIEKVLRMDPRNPVYLDTYGFVLFKMRQLKDAEKVLLHAYSLNSDAMIKEHLDEVRAALAITF